MLIGLCPLDYSTLLLGCKLVSIDNISDGTKVVRVSNDWDRCLNDYGLSGDNERNGVTSKLQKGGVYPDALHRKKISAPPAIREKSNKMHMLRVGKVPSGAIMVAGSKEINQCLEPIRFSRRTRTAKIVLAESFNTVLFDYQSEASSLVDARAVRDWVLTKDPTPPQPSPSMSGDRDADNANAPKSPSDMDVLDSPESQVRSLELAKDDADPPSKRQNTSATPERMKVRGPWTTNTIPTTGEIDEPPTINNEKKQIIILLSNCIIQNNIEFDFQKSQELQSQEFF